ncbi:hypothetical protein K461DRAFT_290142 [Myriangium duriaei CBS 260.36]|uniref:Mediator of RNA polymerase II transcription subunit 4 n=1 Tax=Myriangium duriaei CBS 260.36 TaxID=1168546 RepID=A0A9P4JAA0_9PEZI|nr:hypothetical protein K461DRAFT_290142 [Myriangium duriaei CBS 260.36]
MYSVLQARYQRVEKALDTLLESITAYNPSTAATDELVAADADVNDALSQLASHHANYARILSLRATSAALDEQIKSTLRSLADMRSSLKSISLPPSTPSIPTTTTDSSSHARPVKVSALLSYAKFISKTTVPPTRRDQPATAPAEPTTDAAVPSIVKTEPPTPAAVSSAGPTPGPAADGAQEKEKTQSEAMRKVLPPEVKGQFIPWPGHEVIRAGGLAAVQAMVEAGRDPATVTKSAEEEAAAREEEERQRAREEEERLERERQRREGHVAAMGAHGGRHRDEDVFDPDEM